MKRYVPFLLFALGWLLLRIFWIDCDSGIPSMWEYGFHVTDEGYYLGGGKDMFLWGSFVDLPRGECMSYGYSAGTSWLGYLGYCLFGLSGWAWRLPCVALYFLAWMLMFRCVEKRAGGWFAFAVCLAASCVPLVVVYERGGSNDMVIGALLAISYALAFGPGRWRIPCSALVLSSVMTVKPSVWFFIPIVLSAVLVDRKTRARWLDASLFAGLSVIFVLAWKGVVALTVLGEAERAGLSPFKVLKSVCAHYALPSAFDIARDFLCLSTFPRDPTCKALAAVAVLVSVVPAVLTLVQVVRRTWNPRLLLYLGLLSYLGALTLINTQYSHYYLPLVIMLPAVFAAMREDFAGLRASRGEMRALGVECAIGLGLVGVALMFLLSTGIDPRVASQVYSRIYNLPQANVWTVTWPYLAITVLAGTTAVALKRRFSGIQNESWTWAAAFFAVGSVAFAVLPACVLAPHMHVATADVFTPFAVSLAFGAMFAYAALTCPQAFGDRRLVAAIPVLAVILSYLTVPAWRSAAVELVRPGTHVQDEVAKEIGKLVPHDAILLGERSSQVCMSVPIRTSTIFLANSNPLPVIEALRKRDPNVKLYALADTQHAYMLQHFMKNKDKVALDLVKTFKMPSFATGKLADVHLCRVIVKDVSKRNRK